MTVSYVFEEIGRLPIAIGPQALLQKPKRHFITAKSFKVPANS
jgi:hypothetical protein